MYRKRLSSVLLAIVVFLLFPLLEEGSLAKEDNTTSSRSSILSVKYVRKYGGVRVEVKDTDPESTGIVVYGQIDGSHPNKYTLMEDAYQSAPLQQSYDPWGTFGLDGRYYKRAYSYNNHFYVILAKKTWEPPKFLYETPSLDGEVLAIGSCSRGWLSRNWGPELLGPAILVWALLTTIVGIIFVSLEDKKAGQTRAYRLFGKCFGGFASAGIIAFFALLAIAISPILIAPAIIILVVSLLERTGGKSQNPELPDKHTRQWINDLHDRMRGR